MQELTLAELAYLRRIVQVQSEASHQAILLHGRSGGDMSPHGFVTERLMDLETKLAQMVREQEEIHGEIRIV